MTTAPALLFSTFPRRRCRAFHLLPLDILPRPAQFRGTGQERPVQWLPGSVLPLPNLGNFDISTAAVSSRLSDTPADPRRSPVQPHTASDGALVALAVFVFMRRFQMKRRSLKQHLSGLSSLSVRRSSNPCRPYRGAEEDPGSRDPVLQFTVNRKRMALSYDSLVMDLYWMRISSITGEETSGQACALQESGKTPDITTTLDPAFL